MFNAGIIFISKNDVLGCITRKWKKIRLKRHIFLVVLVELI